MKMWGESQPESGTNKYSRLRREEVGVFEV